MKYVVSICLMLLNLTVFSQEKPVISTGNLEKHVTFLASDSLKGRKPGTPEMDVAAQYIFGNFLRDGLKPLCNGGFQYFDVVTDVKFGEGCKLTVDGTDLEVKSDWIPLTWSESGSLNAPVVFAGFGFDLELDSMHWNDYEGIDAKGKWVMIFRGDPEPDNADSRFIPFSDLRSKILTAKDKGAAGVLLVTPPSFDKEDKLIPLAVENNEVTAGIPAIHVKRMVADAILKSTGFSADSLDTKIIREKRPAVLSIDELLSGQIQMIREKHQTANVVALLEGSDPVLKNEYLVIGAHYDHLGSGGPNSGSRMPDTNAIHNGADDNASGTALVMELARVMAEKNPSPGRSVIFIAFSAEEMGLLGSKYFVDNPPVPLKEITAMFNFDMVGRFDTANNSISVSGTGTSKEADSLLKLHETGLSFSVTHATTGYGPSDHAPFYAANIPVFYFNTGIHTDYHTPFDDTEKLDFEHTAEVGDFALDLIGSVAGMDQPLTFRETGRQESAGRGGRTMKVTLGIMPDFAGAEQRGLRVDGVTKDGPADRGGMQKGDIIISINGMKVGNIYEYMSRLSKLKRGQPINVEVIRAEKNQVLLIQL